MSNLSKREQFALQITCAFIAHSGSADYNQVLNATDDLLAELKEPKPETKAKNPKPTVLEKYINNNK